MEKGLESVVMLNTLLYMPSGLVSISLREYFLDKWCV